MVAPGIPAQRIVEPFEEAFGPARGQVLPCDSPIQLEDASQRLRAADATKFRSTVGMALYLGRDRPDAMYTTKELAGNRSKPTLTSLQHLRKLVGFLKQTGDVGIKLISPMAGNGKWKTIFEQKWMMEFIQMLIEWTTVLTVEVFHVFWLLALHDISPVARNTRSFASMHNSS